MYSSTYIQYARMSEVVFNLYKKQRHMSVFNRKRSIIIKVLNKMFIFRFFIFYSVFLLINSGKNFMMHDNFIFLKITTYNYICFSKLLNYRCFFFEF